jgi:hypothetical protein
LSELSPRDLTVFDPIQCEQYVEMLVRHDEVERALLVLDNIPAQYRDNPPANLRDLRAHIQAARCTPHAYFTEGLDGEPSAEAAIRILHANLRGLLLEWEVRRYNAKGRRPHLVDMGPGEYFIPIALAKLGLDFRYSFVAADQKAVDKAKALIPFFHLEPPTPDDPKIFVALEIIEHLSHTGDLHIECLRHVGGYPERVHLSTPRHTFHIQDGVWKKRCGLPHLRAYTQKEFWDEACKLFQGYTWHFYDGNIMSLVGMRGDVVSEEKLNQEIINELTRETYAVK